MRQVSRFVADTPGDRFSDQRTKMFKELARLGADNVLSVDERDALLRQRREAVAASNTALAGAPPDRSRL